MVTENQRLHMNALVDLLVRGYEEGINVTAFKIDYETGTITISV